MQKSHNNQDKFLQESKELFSKQFIKNFYIFFEINDLNQDDQSLTLADKLIEMNELCLYHLANRLSELQEGSEIGIQTSRKRDKSYQVLEEAAQKAQQEIRKHIGIEHQMKICLEQLEDQLNDLSKVNEEFRKQNSFLKKELAYLKKKQISDSKIIFQYQQKVKEYNQLQLKNKKNVSKLYTQPQATVAHDTSRKSLKKYNDLHNSINKRIVNSKSNGCSKLGSRKPSKMVLENEIDVNLHNFITINKDLKKQPASQVTKTEGKQIFWNRRLKKKQTQSVNNGIYADYITQSGANRSLNISPRQIRKQQKQRQLKDIYSQNTKQLKKSKQLIISNPNSIITRKKQKRGYQNIDAYQLRKSFNTDNCGKDRSKSVVY